jgi:hypothetical protein
VRPTAPRCRRAGRIPPTAAAGCRRHPRPQPALRGGPPSAGCAGGWRCPNLGGSPRCSRTFPRCARTSARRRAPTG